MKLLQLPFWDFFKSMERYPEYFDKTDYWMYVSLSVICLIVAILILCFIGVSIYEAIDKSRSTKEILYGELIDKRYVGEQSSSGVGTAILPGSNGVSVGVVSTSSHSDEEFLFFVRADKVYKVEVDMQQFYGKNLGEKIAIEKRIGGWSKKELDVSLM